jgi:hypothetical protein
MPAFLRQSSFTQKLFWLVWACIFLVNLLYKIQLANTHAPDLGGFERNVIWGIQQVLSGKPLYQSPEKEPFAFVQYMPLYYQLQAGLAKMLGIGASQSLAIYKLARWTNLLFSLGSPFLLGFSAYRFFGVSKSVSIPLSFFSFCLMDQFAISGRPDSLKLFLFQALVFILLLFPEKKKRIVFPLAILLSAAAFLTKQDGLIFSGILPLVLLIQRQWKDLALSVLSILFLLISAPLFLEWNSAGAFFANTAGGLKNGLSISWFLGAFGNFFSLHGVLFSLAMVLSLEFVFEKNWKLQVLAAAFACSFFPPLLFALKFGSGTNYFSEALFISLLIVSILLKRWADISLAFPRASQFLFGAILGALFFYTPIMRWGISIFLNQESRLIQSYQEQKTISEKLKTEMKTDEKVLILTPKQWQDHLTCLLHDKVICPQRDVSLQVFNATGFQKFKALESSLGEGNTSWLITENNQKPAFLELQLSNFKPVWKSNGFQVWKRD